MKYNLVKPSLEEIELIKSKDLKTTNKYYLANYDFIKHIAKSYYHKGIQKLFDYEDMTNEVYLYFYRLSFDNENNFVRSIKNICSYMSLGGERVFHQVQQGKTEILTILDEPVSRGGKHGGEPLYLSDILGDNKDIVDILYPEKSYTEEIFEIIKQFLSPRQIEAWEYFYYSDITARQVGEEMGININGAQSLKTSGMQKMKKNKDKILELVLDLGYNCNFIKQAN